MRVFMALFYFGAGVLHILHPEPFVSITPDWVPWPQMVILATGLCEILGGLALLSARLRRAAGIMLALYALCVFPANIRHAFLAADLPGLPQSWWYHGPRLALQPVLIWWALFCTDVIDWPLKNRTAVRRAG